MASTSTRTGIRAARTGTPAHRGRLRAAAVAAGALAAVAVWAVAVPGLGVTLQTRFGSGAAQAVGVGVVAGASLLAGVAGTGLLVLLERRSARAAAVWTATAPAVLAVSLTFPLWAGTTVAAKATLAVMHLVVAAVLIPALRRTADR